MFFLRLEACIYLCYYLKIMPFQTDAQRRFMYAQHPGLAKRWAKHTPKGKDLPEKKTDSDPEETKALTEHEKKAFVKDVWQMQLGLINNDYNVKNATARRFFSRLAKLYNPNAAAPLFGEAMANRARLKGITGITSNTDPYAEDFWVRYSKALHGSPLGKFLTDKLEHGPHAGTEAFFKRNKNQLFTVLNKDYYEKLIQKGVPESDILRPKEMMGGSLNKLQEYNAWKKWMGETASLGEFEKHLTPEMSVAEKTQKLKELLKEKFKGNKNWVLKLNEGFDTQSSVGTKTPGLFFPEHNNLDLLFSHPLTAETEGGFKNWIAQKNMKLKKINPALKFFDDLFDHSMTGKQEYRIHAINGKVIPWAAQHRGSVTRNLLEAVLPFNTPQMRKAESFAQKMLDKAPKTEREKAFGFDIGFDAKGRPTLIETNPVERDAVSGFTDSTSYHDALNAAIRGDVPDFVKARRLGWGAAGAGAAGAGIYKYNKPEEINTEQPNI